MAYGSVILVPGVNVEQTPTLNRTGVAQSQLIRYRDGLIQKFGGWTSFIGTTVTGAPPRDLHAWKDLNQVSHLAVAAESALSVITNGTVAVITPQIFVSNFTPNFSTINGSSSVLMVDPNLTGIITNPGPVTFNTPVSVGGMILAGELPILSYNNSSTGVGGFILQANATAASTQNNTGLLPEFSVFNGSTTSTVDLRGSDIQDGNIVSFPLATNVGNVTIQGVYQIGQTFSQSRFALNLGTTANTTTFAFMNNNKVQIVYTIPDDLTVVFPPGPQVGTGLVTTDYTSDNWGDILLVCPANGQIFQYQPGFQVTNAYAVANAPAINGGIFVSTQQQILVAWGSSIVEAVGSLQNPLLVQWSDSGDYTTWTPSSTNQAGNYVIPSGTKIVGGMATPNQNLIWTDIDCWSMNYLGFPLVYGFNKIAAGAGLISSHAAQQLGGNVYYMGPQNFYSLTSSGLAVMPCPVWDFVFQNLNPNYVQNVRAMPNTPFNEAGWLFPSTASVSGECDCYVKVNLVEPGNPWDFGPSSSLQRSAWMDESVLGNPISADASGNVWQQEEGNNNGASAMAASFTTGYFYIAEGEEYAFVDQVLPDFIWGEYGAAQTATIQLTFNVVNYPGDTPISYGPYAVTKATEFITVRFRGRQMSITVQSSDLNSFWRIGRIRYRFAKSGRR